MRVFYIILISFTSLVYLQAQNDSVFRYDRGSLYMMMIKHPNLAFNKEIEYVFGNIEKPDRFNDHYLGVKSVQFAEDQDQVKNIYSFIKQVQLGKRMVAKWFNRDKQTGGFDMELVKERGNYNATMIDVNIAKERIRGLSLLEDAGERLLSHTYLVVNDIYYVDKSNRWQVSKDWLNFATSLAEPWLSGGDTGTGTSENPLESSYNWLYGGLMDNIKGFRVKVTSYLFRLKWNDEIAQQFYSQLYTEAPDIDVDKVMKFNESKDLFTLEYVGKVENVSSKTSLFGVKTNEDLIKKVCARALDKNLADLQHSFADFRIKAPLVSLSPLKAYIGMKEDMNEESRYEVLEIQFDEQGKMRYKKVGVIKPVKGKIWDNRYMAAEEEVAEARFNGTEFQKVSGGDFYEGMLIREIK